MAYILGLKQDSRFNLDPRTKLLLLLIFNIVIFHKYDSYILPFIIICVISSLFIFNKKIKLAAISILIYLVFTLLVMYVIPYIGGIFVYLFGIFLITFHKLIPVFLMGMYFILTTSVSEFVAAMEKLHMPKEIIIPFSVIFRFFPTIAEEGASIADAMKMSGLGFNLHNIFTRPLQMLEYWFIPLIMSIVKIGDELSAAVLTRSMDNPVQRTNICEIGFHAIDYLYIIVGLAILLIGLMELL